MTKRRAAAPRGDRRAERSERQPAGEVVLSLRYIETSALVAALLERDLSARAAVRAAGRRVTSVLTFAEAARAVIRARVAGRISAAEERAAVRALNSLERRMDIVSVTDAVLNRVRRPFPVEPIRTLDAVHLASAEVVAEAPQLVTIVTRDMRVRDNAAALGYAVE